MIVIPGPSSRELGVDIARLMGKDAHPVEHRFFPDGENYIKFAGGDMTDEVVIVQTTAPEPDVKFMQLLLMVKTVKDLGAMRIIACVPYLCYSRQDQRFREGEVLSLDVVLGLLNYAGADDLVVIDIHNEENTSRLAAEYEMRVHCLDAIPVLAAYLKEKGYDGACSISPDTGRKDIVQRASGVLGGGFGYFEKKRDLQTGEIAMDITDMNIAGGNAVVFDDIISSGGTMSRAIRGLKDQGVSRVAAACTHALFMEGAEDRLRKAGADEIFASDTVDTPYSEVTVAGLIAEYLINL